MELELGRKRWRVGVRRGKEKWKNGSRDLELGKERRTDGMIYGELTVEGGRDGRID